MAQYIVIKNRHSSTLVDMLQRLEQVCDLLTPDAIKDDSHNTVAVWPEDENTFYAIQNSDGVATPVQGTLTIGWLLECDDQQPELESYEADGSYALVKNTVDGTAFCCDQFGSRTLWYYRDENRFIISTSQRAIVALKNSFNLNMEALAWYLSAGCQGAFISWDQDIKQVLPHLDYRFNSVNWRLSSTQKSGMELPASGSTKMSAYLKIYQKQVTAALKQTIYSCSDYKILLPLSGGLDSRLLLALCKKANLDTQLMLVNWGVPNPSNTFDDKEAAHRVARFYDKGLLDKFLPTQIDVDAYEQIFERFVAASEGRLDHFNAFVDGFKMWHDFYQRGYRMIIRGDIPFPTGLCLNESQIRAKMGLKLFSDYTNISDFEVEAYAKLQDKSSIKSLQRLQGESLIRWRDRTFTAIRVPVILAAFSHQVSAFTENRTPMLNWSMFKLYMGLADKNKGSKRHIKKLWRRYDRSEVSSKAVSSLRPMDSYFANVQEQQYLLNKLEEIKGSRYLSLALVDSVISALSQQKLQDNNLPTGLRRKAIVQRAHHWLTHNLPALPKAYLKSIQAKRLSATTLAYRIVLADKIIAMYLSDAQRIKVGG